MKPLLLAAAVSLLPFVHTTVAESLSIDSVILQTVGTTSNIPGSGDATNTDIWSVGEVGRFTAVDGANTFGIIVSATNPTGSLTAGTDTLMVARTTNSQGLTDTGTLSVYVRSTGRWSLDLNFAIFNATFTAPVNIDLTLTSLDIDFNQRYYTSTTSFSTNQTYAPTNITAAPLVTGFNGFTAAGNSSFSDTPHAVTSKGLAQNSFNIRLSHDNVALYMFEFRDPSVLVPEPTTAALLLGAGILGFARRRRSRN